MAAKKSSGRPVVAQQGHLQHGCRTLVGRDGARVKIQIRPHMAWLDSVDFDDRWHDLIVAASRVEITITIENEISAECRCG